MANGRSLDVLLVEDDAATIEVERRALSRAGLGTQVARCVREALCLIGEGSFRAVLLDYHLPDGNPWAVVDAARAKSGRIPVVLVTGTGSERVAVEALQHGVSDYIIKDDLFWGRLPAVVERAVRLAETEENLRRSNALLDVISDHASDIVSVVDARGIVRFVSPACRRILGYEPDEMVGRHGEDFVHEGDSVRSSFLRAAAAGNPHFTSVFRARRKDGTYVWAEATGSFRREPETGAVVEVLAITRDISERRAAADALAATTDALARSEANLRTLVERVPLGVAVSRGGVVLYANAALVALFAYERPGQIVGRSMLDFVHPEARAFAVDREERIEVGGQPAPDFVRCSRRDGREIVLETTSVTLDADGGTSILSLLRDVTEERRVEAARAQAEAAVRAALAEKDILLREIHHRVKNNLQVIASLVNLQANKLEDGAARVALDEIRARVRAIALLHEKLYQSKDLARIDMREYVVGLVSDLTRMHGSAARGVAVETRVDAMRLDLETAMPCGLILNELLTNALKHAFPAPDAGAPRVEIGLRADDGHLELSVADNGVGLADGTRLEDSSTLGWILVRTLGDQMGASIRLEGQGGVRCTIEFPRS